MTKYTEYVLKQAYAVQKSGESVALFAREMGLNRHNLYAHLRRWKERKGLTDGGQR